MPHQVRKAVVLAAGEGTRLKPITDAIPKEMIRVGKRPAIEHVLRVLKAGGIRDVLVIVGPKKHAIIDYLGSGQRLDLNISYRVQEQPKGTAHATALAEDYIDGEDFVLIYGDNYITPYEAMDDIVRYHSDKDGSGTLVLHPVQDPRRYGVVRVDEDMQIHDMIEKPTLEQAEPYKQGDHWLSIAGLMILDATIFQHIHNVKPGKQGERWLTDAIAMMLPDGLYGYPYHGTRFDIGTFESLREADRLELQRQQR